MSNAVGKTLQGLIKILKIVFGNDSALGDHMAR